MKEYVIAILGATGVVGRQMMECICEYDIPVKELRLLASARSAGKKVTFKGEEITIQEAKPDSFTGCDFVLGAVENAQSQEFAPYIKEAGAVYIDNSSAFRLCDDVPLVVPEINGADAKANNGIIANPNCTTIISLMAIAGIAKLSPVKNMIVSSYQAVSGAGKAGLSELEDQIRDLGEGKEVTPKVFPTQIAMNVIPWIGNDTGNGYTKEEMKLQNEGRKILHMPEMNVTCTCVRVPVLRSHSVSIVIRTEKKLSVEEAEKAIAAYPGVKLIEDLDGRCYPTPLDTSGQDIVYVGRVREDLTDENGLTIWCCGDQIRKGAAANAVQILKYLISE